MPQPKKKRRGPKNMTDVHKEALARGREEGRIVRNYLEGLQNLRPRRGRPRNPDTITRRIEAIEAELDTADPLRRLHLSQERLDLQVELARVGEGDQPSLEDLEQAFIEVAANYAERKGISYAAFREIGVPAAVLKAAGISRAVR